MGDSQGSLSWQISWISLVPGGLGRHSFLTTVLQPAPLHILLGLSVQVSSGRCSRYIFTLRIHWVDSCLHFLLAHREVGSLWHLVTGFAFLTVLLCIWHLVTSTCLQLEEEGDTRLFLSLSSSVSTLSWQEETFSLLHSGKSSSTCWYSRREEQVVL